MSKILIRRLFNAGQVTIVLACIAAVLTPICLHAEENPVEIGAVKWGRDLEAAKLQSRETGKPVFLLFQEVPGCAGCQEFGAKVLSHPLLVEAIEDEFIPVVAYNNTSGGPDERLRKQYGEPAFNYQVVRFLDADGADIIPRKDRVWEIGGTASRMIEALKAADRPAPRYLEALAAEYSMANQSVTAFAMYCFWTGEHLLGQVDGVIRTEAGWMEGHEATLVVYQRDKVSLERLTKIAAKNQCADKVYAPEANAKELTGVPVERLTSEYRKASASDQKKQLARWKALHRVPNLTPMQLTKINAFAPVDMDKALEWLSPRQRAALIAAK